MNPCQVNIQTLPLYLISFNRHRDNSLLPAIAKFTAHSNSRWKKWSRLIMGSLIFQGNWVPVNPAYKPYQSLNSLATFIKLLCSTTIIYLRDYPWWDCLFIFIITHFLLCNYYNFDIFLNHQEQQYHHSIGGNIWLDFHLLCQ